VSLCLCVFVSLCLCVYVSLCLCVFVSLCLCVFCLASFSSVYAWGAGRIVHKAEILSSEILSCHLGLGLGLVRSWSWSCEVLVLVLVSSCLGLDLLGLGLNLCFAWSLILPVLSSLDWSCLAFPVLGIGTLFDLDVCICLVLSSV
jgi:hypothetical protein